MYRKLNVLLIFILLVGIVTATDRSIDKHGESMVAYVGDRVSMECNVTGTKIIWSREENQETKDAILDDSSLIIRQVKLDDAGIYICRAVNEAGSISSKIVLLVKVRTTNQVEVP